MKISDIPPQDIAAAQKLYETTNVPVREIAASLGINTRRLYVNIHKWGWHLRTENSALVKKKNRQAAVPLNASAQEADSDASCDNLMTRADQSLDGDAVGLSRRLDEIVRRELATAEERLRSGSVANAERNARVLTALVKAMAELARLERQEKGAERYDADHSESARDEHDDEPPTDVAELRAELARRLEILRRSRNG